MPQPQPQLTTISQVASQLSSYVFLQQMRAALLAIMAGVNPGVASTAIPSAATIAPVSQLTPISGSAVIETITAVGFSPGAVVSLLAAPAAAWSIGTTGNVPLGLSVVNPGQVYSFVFDGTDWRQN